MEYFRIYGNGNILATFNSLYALVLIGYVAITNPLRYLLKRVWFSHQLIYNKNFLPFGIAAE